jgi:hypothetical protein
MSKTELIKIFDNLESIRCKQQYLNEVNMSWLNDIADGKSDIHMDSLTGKHQIALGLELEFENILKQLNELI